MIGNKDAEERADELNAYCWRHINYRGKSTPSIEEKSISQKELYRIFYYDCLPVAKKVYHPLLKRTIDRSKNEMYQWMHKFLDELKRKRKFAIRLGQLAEEQARYTIRYDVLKCLFNGTKSLDMLKEDDFQFEVEQKGVDMKIGLDIASLAYKKLVDQIVLISGDSDFVPAAKLARREGIDFILDPLFVHIKPDLFEHIDGLRTCDTNFKPNSVKQN